MTLTLADIQSIEKPHPNQLKLYIYGAIIGSLTTCGLAIPIALLALIPLLIRYYTMRYRFDENGVGVSYGWLFRHESYITYDKIQDIHLNRGLLERWLELGTVDVQTASGSAGAEISLIGLTEFDDVRDYLYMRMRSGRGLKPIKKEGEEGSEHDDAALKLLASIRDEVVALKQNLSKAPQNPSPAPTAPAESPNKAETEGGEA